MREKHGHYQINGKSVNGPRILTKKGIQIENPQTYIHPPKPEWKPTRKLPNDFRLQRFIKPKKEEQKTSWNVLPEVNFTEGLDQACLLTKTQGFHELPKQVQNLMGKYSVQNQDECVKEAISRSQIWDSTVEKLPKYRDLANVGFRYPRMYGIPDKTSAQVLLTRFLHMCQSMCLQFSELATDRRVIYKPATETMYNFRGEKIYIKFTNDFMICGYNPLSQPGDKRMIQESINHNLHDMYPILPTVDLQPIAENKFINNGVFKEQKLPWSNPQISFRVNPTGRPKKYQGYNLMTTFGLALTEARNKYNIENTPLDIPITLININLSFDTINFLVFQLNTMDFQNEDGIKNFAWFDSEKLFTKTYCQPWLEPRVNGQLVFKPPEFSDYNKKAFEKFLALYLYDYDKPNAL